MSSSPLNLADPIPEVLDMIFDNIRNDKNALKTCVSVSQTWRQHALSLLFHTRSYTIASADPNHARTFSSLAQVLNTPNSGMASRIVVLELNSLLLKDRQAESVVPGGNVTLDILYLSPALFASIVRPLSSLRNLKLKSITTPPGDEGVDLLSLDKKYASFPGLRLESLHIQRIQATDATILAFLDQFESIGELHITSFPNNCRADTNWQASSSTKHKRPAKPYIGSIIILSAVSIHLRNNLYNLFFLVSPPPYPVSTILMTANQRQLVVHAAGPSDIEEVFYIGERIHAEKMHLSHLNLDLINHYHYWADRSKGLIPDIEFSRLHLEEQTELKTILVSILTGDGTRYYAVPANMDRVSWTAFLAILSALPATFLERLMINLRLRCEDSGAMHAQLNSIKWSEVVQAIRRFVNLKTLTVFVYMSGRKPMDESGHLARQFVESKLKTDLNTNGRTVDVDVHLAPMWSPDGTRWTFIKV